MDEDEFQRIVSGAAGALADTWKKTSDFINNENQSFPWAPRTTVQERYNTPEGSKYWTPTERLIDWVYKNPETAEKIIMGGAGAAAGLPPELAMLSALAAFKEFMPDLLERIGLTPEPLPAGEGRGDESGKDVPTFVPYDPGEFEGLLHPREEWAMRWPNGETYPGDMYGYVNPLISGIGAKRNEGSIVWGVNRETGEWHFLRDSEGNYIRSPIPDYSELKTPYPNALNLYARGRDIHKYVGKPGYENLSGLESPEKGSDVTSWMRQQYSELDALLEEEYEEEQRKARENFDKRNEEEERRHREEYDKMVADMLAEQELEASSRTAAGTDLVEPDGFWAGLEKILDSTVYNPIFDAPPYQSQGNPHTPDSFLQSLQALGESMQNAGTSTETTPSPAFGPNTRQIIDFLQGKPVDFFNQNLPPEQVQPQIQYYPTVP